MRESTANQSLEVPAPTGGKSRSALTHDDRHDLRGTLSAIQAFAELLQDEISGPLNPEQHDHVRRMLRNAVKLSRQIDAFRDTE
jgi:signal transduction histidine kinase